MARVCRVPFSPFRAMSELLTTVAQIALSDPHNQERMRRAMRGLEDGIVSVGQQHSGTVMTALNRVLQQQQGQQQGLGSGAAVTSTALAVARELMLTHREDNGAMNHNSVALFTPSDRKDEARSLVVQSQSFGNPREDDAAVRPLTPVSIDSQKKVLVELADIQRNSRVAAKCSSEALTSAQKTMQSCESALVTLAEENAVLAEELNRSRATHAAEIERHTADLRLAHQHIADLEAQLCELRERDAWVSQHRREKSDGADAERIDVSPQPHAPPPVDRGELAAAYEALRCAEEAHRDLTRSLAAQRDRNKQLEAQLGEAHTNLTVLLDRESKLRDEADLVVGLRHALDAANAELHQRSVELDKARMLLEANTRDAELLTGLLEASRKRLGETEPELLRLRKRVRELEDQARATERLSVHEVAQRSLLRGPSHIETAVCANARDEAVTRSKEAASSDANFISRPIPPELTPPKSLTRRSAAHLSPVDVGAEPRTPTSQLVGLGRSPLVERRESRALQDSARVEHVLLDARHLIDTIAASRRSAHELLIPKVQAQQSDARRALAEARSLAVQRCEPTVKNTPLTERSLNSCGGSSSSVRTASRPPQKHAALRSLYDDLRAELSELDAEEKALSQQHASVLEKREAVSATLLAQRNQKMLAGAPAADVEHLNTQIALVTDKIKIAVDQITANQRRVDAKRQLVLRQLRHAESELDLANGGLASTMV